MFKIEGSRGSHVSVVCHHIQELCASDKLAGESWF